MLRTTFSWHKQLFNISYFCMEESLYSIFCTSNPIGLIDLILEYSYKVLPGKEKISNSFNNPYIFYGPLYFSTINTFKVL